MKIKCIALLLACLLAMLTACQPVGDGTQPPEPETTLSYYPPKTFYNYGRDHELPYPVKAVYCFNRYEELVSFLKEEKNTEKTVEEWGEDWANYLDYVKEVNTPSENDTPLYIPYINGEPAKLQATPFDGGYYGIYFASESAVGSPPYVAYCIDIGREDPLRITCWCLSQKNFAWVDGPRTLDAVRSLEPIFPDLDSYESDSYSDPYYESVFEERIEFSGKRILAVYAFKWEWDDTVWIAFDKTLVTIEGPAELLTNRDFLASISLQKAELP